MLFLLLNTAYMFPSGLVFQFEKISRPGVSSARVHREEDEGSNPETVGLIAVQGNFLKRGTKIS